MEGNPQNVDPAAYVQGLQQRLNAALEGFQKLNQHAAGVEYHPPHNFIQSSGLIALVDTLEQAGLQVRMPWMIRSLTMQCDVAEKSLREAADDLRRRTGVIVPVGFSTRPQG
jgi:hypothetical protein